MPLPRGLASRHFGFVLGTHVVDRGLNLVRIANAVQENQARIRSRETAEIPLGLRWWWSVGITNLRDQAGELEGVHAATGKMPVTTEGTPKRERRCLELHRNGFVELISS